MQTTPLSPSSSVFRGEHFLEALGEEPGEIQAVTLLLRLTAIQPLPCSPYPTAMFKAALEGTLPSVPPDGRYWLLAERLRTAVERVIVRHENDPTSINQDPFGGSLLIGDLASRVVSGRSAPLFPGCAPEGTELYGFVVLRRPTRTSLANLVAALEAAALDGIGSWGTPFGTCESAILAIAEGECNDRDPSPMLASLEAGESIDRVVSVLFPQDCRMVIGDSAQWVANAFAASSPISPFCRRGYSLRATTYYILWCAHG